jgi:acyl-CoA thioester hydrolase
VTFHHRVRARFAETDAMGVVHHAAYLPWLEEARVAYLRSIGHPYAEVRASGIDIAVIEVSVRYRLPARFDDEIDVEVALGTGTAARFPITYTLRRGDDLVATATTVHACLDAATGRPLRVPGWLRS